MKPLKIALFCILITQIAVAQQNISLKNFNCFSASVKFAAKGELFDGILLFVNCKDSIQEPNRFAEIIFLNKNGTNTLLAGRDNFITGVYDIKASVDSKYLALYIVSEGHSWIEIIDLQKFIIQSIYDVIAEIQPYPGNVDLIGWKTDKLQIESDINLILKNDNKELNENHLFEKRKKFLFDVQSKKYLMN